MHRKFFLLASICFFCFLLNLISVSAHYSDNDIIKTTISEYFTEYFESQKNLCFSTISSNILENNENTQMIEAFRETVVAEKTLFDGRFSNYKYEITYQSINVVDNTATVDLTLDLDFHYANAPSDMKSGIYGIVFNFFLQDNGTNWVITKIESNFDEYQAFKNQVREKMAQDTTLTQAMAVAQVVETIKSQLQSILKSGLYQSGNLLPTTSNTNFTKRIITKSVYLSCDEYTYNPENAVLYAERYAEDEDSTCPFCVMEEDSTNFVSQCIWAGYGGYVRGDDTQTFNNIINHICMIYSEWHADTVEAAINWANAKNFFKYMVIPSKVAGPNATTDYSDYDIKRYYTDVPAGSINVGDVLQLWISDFLGYNRSIFITKKLGTSTNCTYSQIYYSSHTTNRRNYQLSSLLLNYPYIRRLTPAATCYLS
jgi:hypothetical protein